MTRVVLANDRAPESDGDPLSALARRASDGDVAATRELLEALAPPLARVVRAVMGHASAEAEDATQEALISLVRALPAFRGECSVRRYASRIAVRAAVAVRSRLRAQRARLEPLAVDERAAPSADPAAAERRDVVRTLLDELPEAQGETLALRFLLGCSLEEIAASTGAPVNTVRSRMRLAKEALRKRIEADPALAERLELDA